MTERAKCRLLMTIAVLAAAIGAVWIDDFFELDSCLDAGGSYNEDWGFCERDFRHDECLKLGGSWNYPGARCEKNGKPLTLN